MRPNNRILGITGGIGTGKSTVLRYLEEAYDAYVVEADRLAESMMQPGNDLYDRVVAAFPTCVVAMGEPIDRKALGTIVFADSKALATLNGLVHPAVKEEILRRIETVDTKLFVIEAALLLEDGYRDICDAIWNIAAPEEVRLQRLQEGRGISKEKALSVIRNQKDETFYLAGCDETIDNSGTEEEVKKRVDKAIVCFTNPGDYGKMK